MPLETTVNTNPPPVEIEVGDSGGGGGGKSKFVDLHVTWNKDLLEFVAIGPGGHKCSKDKGVAHWHKLKYSPTKKKVWIQLKRKAPGTAYVVICAMDPVTGARSSKRKTHP